MEEPKENKVFEPVLNKAKTVKVKINKNREITGVGKAGDVVSIDEAIAKKYERDGYVTILKEN